MMLATFFKKVWFGDKKNASRPPKIQETTPFEDVLKHHPDAVSFFQSRFGVLLSDQHLKQSLKEISEAFELPPAQVLYMEIQLESRIGKVRRIKAKQAKALIDLHPDLKLLDVRESWERAFGIIPGALAWDLKETEALAKCPKETPVLVYCHFGVRSLDAAAYLADQGFTQVHALEGGIDAWSTEIDDSIPRYSGSYC